MQGNKTLRLVKPGDSPLSEAELAIEEIDAMRQGIDRLESLCKGIFTDKRRQLDRLEIAIQATSGQEIPPVQAA